MKKWFAKMWTGLKSHPVELIVLLHTMVAVIVNESAWWMRPTTYAPFAVVAALCLWFHREHRWTKWIYWAVLPLYALCVLLPAEWHRTPEMRILYYLLVPAYMLVRGGNDFSGRFFSMVRSLAVSSGVGMLTCLLLLLINESVVTLFDIRYGSRDIAILSFSFVLLAPMVFIGMESVSGELRASKLEEALVNWVLMPALLIYNVVLYAYLYSIMVEWELPKGSVATMVTAFMVALIGVRWLRPMLTKQPLEWYFRWSGLLALPLVALFWVAVGYRIGQYGLTIERCMLIAGGVGMTVYAIASLFRLRRGGYGFMALTVAVGLLAVFAARPLSMHSQTNVARHNAAVAGVLADDGTLQIAAMDKADTVYRAEHRRVYQAMKYMGDELHDTAAVRQRLGMTSEEYLKLLSPETYNYATAWCVDRYDDEPEVEAVLIPNHYVRSKGDGVLVNPGDYSRMYVNVKFSDGKITVGGNTISADSVLAVQLAEIGYTMESNLDDNRLDVCADQLCVYNSPDGRMLIIFQYFYIEHSDDGNHMDHGLINCALIK